MANILRLIFFALLFASSLSHAALAPVLQPNAAEISSLSSSRLASCNQNYAGCSVSVVAGPYTHPVGYTCAVNQSCVGVNTATQGMFSWDISYWIASCPQNSTSQGSSCVCSAGFEEKDGQCRPVNVCPDGQHEEGGACVPNSCKANETRVNGVCVPEPACPAGETRVNGVCQKSNCKTGAVAGYYDMTSPTTVSTCSHDGAGTYCTMLVEWTMTAPWPEGARYYGVGRLTGSSCAPAPDGPGSPTPTDPPKPPDPNTPKPTQPATPGAPAGGSPGQTRPGSSPGTDGSCPPDSYKSNGACYPKNPPPEAPDSDGKCPVGTIKVGSVCAVLQPAPDDKPEDKKPSVFGGACNAVACEGDAIQCAIARDQYKRSCELMEKESAESQLYTVNKGKEGNQTGSLPGNQTINMAGRIDASDALGAGSAGVADLSVTVWGQSVTLPFSMLNPYLAALGNVLLSVSFLIALRIVARG